jgi:hypothetical protein
MRVGVKRKSMEGFPLRLALLAALILMPLISNTENGVYAFDKNRKVVSGDADTVESPPSVGAFRKNFKGEVTKVITETSNSETTLPLLRYEDHTWEGHSIELQCNATYPVQWTYSGVGVGNPS